MNRRLVRCAAFAILVCLLFPMGTMAASGRDFTNPKALGGAWLAKNTVQGNAYEPLNVVIGAQSDPSVKQDLVNYLEIVGYSNCGGGQVDVANVGSGYQHQAFEIRNGGCLEVPFGGNHLRGWKQNQTGAWFLAVSEEENITTGHRIAPNGFNDGRDYLASQVSNKDFHYIGRYYFRTRVERIPGCPPSPNPPPGSYYCAGTGTGNVNGRPYDGKIVLLTVSLIQK